MVQDDRTQACITRRPHDDGDSDRARDPPPILPTEKAHHTGWRDHALHLGLVGGKAGGTGLRAPGPPERSRVGSEPSDYRPRTSRRRGRGNEHADGVAGFGPSMEHGDKTDLGTEKTRIGGDCVQCLGRCLEQDVVDNALSCSAMPAIAAGIVNTRWKYGTAAIRLGARPPRRPRRALAFRVIACPCEGRARLRQEL